MGPKDMIGLTRFTDIETLTRSISFYLYLNRMQKIEEIRKQADLFYLHALYEFIDMITNRELSRVTWHAYLICRVKIFMRGPTRIVISFLILLRIKLGGCCCDLFTGYYKYSFVCPGPAQLPLNNTCGVDIY